MKERTEINFVKTVCVEQTHDVVEKGMVDPD